MASSSTSSLSSVYPMPFNRLAYSSAMGSVPSIASSESQSDVSSIGSDWSDVKVIAERLGITDESDLKNDRFKVDRQKLENMIKSIAIYIYVNAILFSFIFYYSHFFLFCLLAAFATV